MRSWTTSTTVDVPIVNAAETAVMTTGPISTSLDGDSVVVSGSLFILTGASTTAVTVRVRRGNGVAGVVVGDPIPLTVGAAASAPIPFAAIDLPGAVAGQVYTITATQTAGSANGTVGMCTVTVAVGQP